MKVTENDGLLAERDYSAFKEKSINIKFAWQMFAALGGATFFGLLSAIATPLMTGAAITLSPVVGGVFAVFGIACVYMAQRYFFESSTLDQDFNAKKIAAATTKAQQQALEQQAAQQQERPNTMVGINQHSERPPEEPENPLHSDKIWTETVQRRDAAAISPKAKAESWERLMEAAEEATPATGQRLH